MLVKKTIAKTTIAISLIIRKDWMT